MTDNRAIPATAVGLVVDGANSLSIFDLYLRQIVPLSIATYG